MHKFLRIMPVVGVLLLASCGKERTAQQHASNDSIYTKEYISSIYTVEPERALALIDTAEMYKKISVSMCHVLRAQIYQNTLQQPRLAYYHFQQAVANPLFEKENPSAFCASLNMLSEREYRTNHFDAALRYAQRGLEVARREGVKRMELQLEFAVGRIMMSSGDVNEGLRIVMESLAAHKEYFAQPQNFVEANQLVYITGESMELLMKHNRLKEAEHLIPDFEHAVELLANSPDVPPFIVDIRQMEMNANIMRLYDALGEHDKAEPYLQGVLACRSDQTISYMRAAAHYLVTKRYDLFFPANQRAGALFGTNYDSISNDYVNGVLIPAMQAYTAIGNDRQAHTMARRIIAIKDSLTIRSQQGDAAQLAAIYATQEKEMQLVEQKRLLERQQTYLIASVVGLLLALLFTGVMIYYNRRIDRESRANEIKDHFIRNMSHEIRTPLNQISGFVQLLTDPALTMEAEEKQHINDIITQQTECMTRMLNVFLEMSEYEGDERPLPAGTVDVELLLSEVGEATPYRQQGVEWSVSNTTPLKELVTNAEALKRLLVCLTENAAKFTEQGSIRLDLSEEEEGKVICFSVTDTGKGVPVDQAEKIFERFYKVDEYVPGVGLGLSLARAIAKRIGATVTLDTSHPAPGARFTVKFARKRIVA